MRALTADRKATTVTQAAIAAEVHEALDVHRGFATKITFDAIIAVDGFADLKDFGVSQLMDALLSRKKLRKAELLFLILRRKNQCRAKLWLLEQAKLLKAAL